MRKLCLPMLGFILLSLSALVLPASAQQQKEPDKKTVRAGVFIHAPFVMMGGEKMYLGMAVDLWRVIEARLGVQTEYIRFHEIDRIINAAASGDIDIIISNISVTSERAKRLRFSYPWYDSGLRIMVKKGSGSVWETLKDSGHIMVYLMLVLLLIGLSILLTLARRRWDGKSDSKWREGLSLSFYELVVAARSGRLPWDKLGWIGHTIAACWMLAGVALIAYVTSTLASAMTMSSLEGSINSINDLPGKTVGVLQGSAGERFMKEKGFEVVPYGNMENLSRALTFNEVEAVVDDAPVLEYWAYNNFDLGVKVVGNILNPDKYAFAVGPHNLELIDRVSMEIIDLHELGLIQQLKNNYFGRMNM